jgi:hypothetical protein
MAQFITRVELHGAGHDEPAYQTLHDSMEAHGFKRTIKADDKKVYHLLTAEYEITADSHIHSIIESAKEAAATTGKKYSVFVSEITNASWWNLKEL